MRRIKILLFLIYLCFLVSFIFDPALTGFSKINSESLTGPVVYATNDIPEVNVTSSLKHLANWLFYILIILGAIFVLVAALEFVTSSGNPEAVTRARNTLMYALAGVAIGILAKGLVQLVIYMVYVKK